MPSFRRGRGFGRLRVVCRLDWLANPPVTRETPTNRSVQEYDSSIACFFRKLAIQFVEMEAADSAMWRTAVSGNHRPKRHFGLLKAPTCRVLAPTAVELAYFEERIPDLM